MRLGGRHDEAQASRCRTTTLSMHRTVVAPGFEPLAGQVPGKRGSLPIWLDKQNTWLAPHEGRPWNDGFSAVWARIDPWTRRAAMVGCAANG